MESQDCDWSWNLAKNILLAPSIPNRRFITYRYLNRPGWCYNWVGYMKLRLHEKVGINFSGAWTLPNSELHKNFTNFHIRLLCINGYNNDNKNNNNKKHTHIYVECVMGCHAIEYIMMLLVMNKIDILIYLELVFNQLMSVNPSLFS